MRTRTLLLALAVIASDAAPFTAPIYSQESRKPDAQGHEMDEATRFIFYSVLEGLYDDGVSNEDVAQILMKRENEAYFHFIYACPICNATIWALQAYQGRPESFYGLKRPGSTFGAGLTEALHKQLHSAEPTQRLTAINTMVGQWMERRMKRMNLSSDARKSLLTALEKKRKEGMEMLASFRRKEHGENFGVAQAAPAYADLKECAVCNAVVGKPMQLPGQKPK